MLAGAGGGVHRRPEVPGDLHRGRAHAAGRGVDEHGLARAQPAEFDEPVPRGQERHGHRRGLREAPPLGHRRDHPGVGHGHLAERALEDAHDLVAGGEPGDVRGDVEDHAGAFPAEPGLPGHHAEADQYVAEVDTARADGDTDLARLQRLQRLGERHRRHTVDRRRPRGVQPPGRPAERGDQRVRHARPHQPGYGHPAVADRHLRLVGVDRVADRVGRPVAESGGVDVHQHEPAGVLRLRAADQAPHGRADRIGTGTADRLRHRVPGDDRQPGVGEQRLGQPLPHQRQRLLHGLQTAVGAVPVPVATRHLGQHDRRHRGTTSGDRPQRVQVRQRNHSRGPQPLTAEHRPLRGPLGRRRSRGRRRGRPLQGEQPVRVLLLGGLELFGGDRSGGEGGGEDEVAGGVGQGEVVVLFGGVVGVCCVGGDAYAGVGGAGGVEGGVGPGVGEPELLGVVVVRGGECVVDEGVEGGVEECGVDGEGGGVVVLGGGGGGEGDVGEEVVVVGPHGVEGLVGGSVVVAVGCGVFVEGGGVYGLGVGGWPGGGVGLVCGGGVGGGGEGGGGVVGPLGGVGVGVVAWVVGAGVDGEGALVGGVGGGGGEVELGFVGGGEGEGVLEEEFGEGGVGVVGGVEGPLEEGGAGEEGGGVDGVLGEPGVVCGGGEESGVVEGAVGGVGGGGEVGVSGGAGGGGGGGDPVAVALEGVGGKVDGLRLGLVGVPGGPVDGCGGVQAGEGVGQGLDVGVFAREGAERHRGAVGGVEGVLRGAGQRCPRSDLQEDAGIGCGQGDGGVELDRLADVLGPVGGGGDGVVGGLAGEVADQGDTGWVVGQCADGLGELVEDGVHLG